MAAPGVPAKPRSGRLLRLSPPFPLAFPAHSNPRVLALLPPLSSLFPPLDSWEIPSSFQTWRLSLCQPR